MKLVDSHCHLDNEQYDEDRNEVIDRIEDELEFCVNIGYDIESSKKSVEFSEKYNFIYATVGIHPVDIEKFNSKTEKELEILAKNKKVVAIGEIGLDYHWMSQPKEIQQMGFIKQMEIARKLNLPVVIHSRDAMEDTLDILNQFPEISGVIHCYPGSVETAKQVIDRYYLGIGGALTFKNSRKLVDVVKEIPLDRLVLETDAPYITPVPFRGMRNEPNYVLHVAKKIAEIKEISVEEVIKITTENSKKLYKINL